jgi:hypothetical protein
MDIPYRTSQHLVSHDHIKETEILLILCTVWFPMVTGIVDKLSKNYSSCYKTSMIYYQMSPLRVRLEESGVGESVILFMKQTICPVIYWQHSRREIERRNILLPVVLMPNYLSAFSEWSNLPPNNNTNVSKDLKTFWHCVKIFLNI